jgi:hypothetical protein
MKPVTERDNAPFAPGQIPYELTDAERSKAAVYSLDLERQRRERNRRDRLRYTPDNDPKGAA